MNRKRLHNFVRKIIVLAFSSVEMPTQEGFSKEELNRTWYQNVSNCPVTSEEHLLAQDRHWVYTQEAFNSIQGVHWSQVTWNTLLNIEPSSLSLNTFHYYIQSFLLNDRYERDEIVHEYNLTPLWESNWLKEFLAQCTIEQQKAIWLYVKLVALEGDGMARQHINDFWKDWNFEHLGRRIRVKWDEHNVWSNVVLKSHLL